MDVPEKIERAAIQQKGVVYSVPAPGRHHHVIQIMDEQHGLGPEAQHDQGFYTSMGRFVGRIEAVDIAKAAGQITEPRWPPQLYSEDLW
jgi:hypothetical protein